MDDTTSEPIEEFLEALVETLPRTVQFSEIAAARIRCGPHTTTTEGFEPLDRGLSVETETSDGTPIELDVVYLEDRPPADEGPFLAEERATLNAFAELLGGYVERCAVDMSTEDSSETDASVSSRDITAHEQTDRELQRQNERFDEFVSIVSHELRNPLNAAQGHLELAKEQYNDDFEVVFRSLDRIETLIADAVALAREGAEIETYDRVDLRRLAEECWDAVETADATLEVEARGWMVGERDRLAHLFENLFRNAIAHGGSDATVRVESLRDGFAVADDGPGIPPEERERVFEAGYSTTRHGTGFGLRIVLAIAEAHGWHVDLTESSEGGARFEFHGVAFD